MGDSTPLIVTVGDLITDVVVDLDAQFRVGTDTAASIVRRRGGSAANVAAAAVAAGGRARFVGNVGSDDAGDELLAGLAAVGVETSCTRNGTSGTVVAVVDPGGERSLLTDRGASGDLAAVPSGAMVGCDVVHVPLYALGAEPLATTVASMLLDAHAAGALTSVDASSVPVVESVGPEALLGWCRDARVDVLFCNEDEAEAIGHDLLLDHGPPVVIEKRGAAPAMLIVDGEVGHVAAEIVDDVVDTTGAGDAFAAGVLVARAASADWPEAVAAGHRLAAQAVTRLGAL